MYPRLIQRYGRNCVKESLIKACHKDRTRVLVGPATYEEYGLCLKYKEGWKSAVRERKERLKPARDVSQSVLCSQRTQPPVVDNAPRLDISMAARLQEIRPPQLHEAYVFTDHEGQKANCILGLGREGVVRCASKLGDNCSERFAVKTIEKQEMQFARTEDNPILREVDVLKKLPPHPNVAKLVDVFQSPVRLHIVTECFEGGDLYNFEDSKADASGFVPEAEEDVRRVVYKILSAVQHCHDKQVVHLDIKLENIMRKREGSKIDEGDVVLIDFGHSKDIKPTADGSLYEGTLSQPVGSASYAAPEVVLEKKFNERSDLWSLGVLTYTLLLGTLPFPHLQRKRWYHFTKDDYCCTQNDPFAFEHDWDHITPEGKDFAERLLQFNLAERMSVAEAMAHPWMQAHRKSVPDEETSFPLQAQAA